jgi:hypothetical protein
MTPTLTDEHRSKLDGIVSQMHQNGEDDSSIQAVVNDYKGKYGATVHGMEKLGATPGIGPVAHPEGLQPDEPNYPGPFAQAHPIMSELWKGTAIPMMPELAAQGASSGALAKGGQMLKTIFTNPKAREEVAKQFDIGKAFLTLRKLATPAEEEITKFTGRNIPKGHGSYDPFSDLPSAAGRKPIGMTGPPADPIPTPVGKLKNVPQYGGKYDPFEEMPSGTKATPRKSLPPEEPLAEEPWKFKKKKLRGLD